MKDRGWCHEQTAEHLVSRYVTQYASVMALIHNHKGLKKFDLSDSTAGIKQDHAPRLRRVLSLLKVSDEPSAMNLPGYRLHALKGDWKGYWSVDVSGNWRIYFKFQDGDVLVEYLDPH